MIKKIHLYKNIYFEIEVEEEIITKTMPLNLESNQRRVDKLELVREIKRTYFGTDLKYKDKSLTETDFAIFIELLNAFISNQLDHKKVYELPFFRAKVVFKDKFSYLAIIVKDEILFALKNSSIIHWSHINFYGEYNFTHYSKQIYSLISQNDKRDLLTFHTFFS